MSQSNIEENKNLTYDVTCNSIANMSDALDIWVKFIGHFSAEDMDFLNELSSVSIRSMDSDKLEKYIAIKERMEVSKLIEKYKKKECTKEEHDKVFNYMQRTSLKALVNKSVSEHEALQVYLFLKSLETEEDLERYISYNDINYDRLSIYDAYILFQAKEKLYNLKQKELNEIIKLNEIDKEKSLEKSLSKNINNRV